MKERRPIDIIRESGVKAEIGTPEDGAIIEMKSIGSRLLVIKERAIYEVVFADTIDPDRVNINLPQTIHKLIIDQGTESEIVARTFLTAKTLFKTEYIAETVDCDKILSLAIDLLSELSVMQKEINIYQEVEKRAIEEYEKRRSQKTSFELPTVVNIEPKCKTIFQKADQIEQILMDIIIHFYANKDLNKQSHFPKLHDILVSMYGSNDIFVEYIGTTLPFMRVIRELRNGFDHRLKHTKVKDFELKIDGDILSPTIELNYKDVKLERISLNEFLNVPVTKFIDIIEMTFAFLAGYNARDIGISYQVRQIPEEKRRHKLVKYSFWMPFGDEGFYVQ